MTKKKYKVLENIELLMPRNGQDVPFKWDAGSEIFIEIETEAERLLAEKKVEFIEEVEIP